MYVETGAAIRQETSDQKNAELISLHKKESKVDTICNAILQTLCGQKSSRFQNVITAHVCKSPPDLDAGLIEIAKIRGMF